MRFPHIPKLSAVEPETSANLGQDFFYFDTLARNLRARKNICPEIQVISPQHIEEFLAHSGLNKKIKKLTANLDVRHPNTIRAVSARIISAIMRNPLGSQLNSLLKKTSATHYQLFFTGAEAGDFHLLNQNEFVHTKKNFERNFKKTVAQLYNPELMINREQRGFTHTFVPAAVLLCTRSTTAEHCVVETTYRGVETHIASLTIQRNTNQSDTYLFFKPNLLNGQPALLNVIPESSVVSPEAISLITEAVKLEAQTHTQLVITAYLENSSKCIFLVGLQTRRSTVPSQFSEEFILTKKVKPLVHGVAIGTSIAVGTARILATPADYKKYQPGEIIVLKKFVPECLPLIATAAGCIFESATVPADCTVAIRNFGIPCILRAEQATKIITSGTVITVSCANHEDGTVFAGALPYEVKQTPVSSHHKTGIQLIESVFSTTPSMGSRATRTICIDDIIAGQIKIHPVILCAKKSSETTQKYSAILFSALAQAAAFNYPESLTIALSSAPRRVFEDLIKGKTGEAQLKLRPGARGAERYLSPGYEDVVAAECRVLALLQETLRLKNIRLQLPYCRSPFELEKVLAVFESQGISRTKGWKFTLQTDFPGHGLLTKSFAAHVDTLVFDIDTLVPEIMGERITVVTPEIQKTVETVLAQIVRTARQSKTDVAVSGALLSRQPKLVFSTVKSGVRSMVIAPNNLSVVRGSVIEAERTVGNTGYATNQRWLGLVAGLAVLGSLLMSVGAGCGFNAQTYSEQNQGTQTPQMTPAQIRAEITSAVEANEREWQKKNPIVTIVNGFAHFSIAYPKSWVAEYKPDGFILSDSESSTTLKFYKQLVKNNPDPQTITSIMVDGNSARFFPVTTTSSTPPTWLYEIAMPNNSILEISSPTSNETINKIINSIVFLPKN